MKLEIKHLENLSIVVVREKRLDAETAGDFKQQMLDLINQGYHNILLNLSEVDFMDSTGIGAIISSLKALDRRGDIVLCEVKSSKVMQVIQITRMDKILQIFETEEKAVTHF